MRSAASPQARIIALNSHYFLKNGGHFVISIKASCIDSTAPPEAVFAKERSKLTEEGLKPLEQLTLEPFERDHVRSGGAAARRREGCIVDRFCSAVWKGCRVALRMRFGRRP